MNYIKRSKVLILLFCMGSLFTLQAQFVLAEYHNESSHNGIMYKNNFEVSNYTQTLAETNKKIYLQNLPVKKNKAEEVTLNINLQYDPGQFMPWSILVYNDSGYLNRVDWLGSNVVTTEVPEGTYDILVQFDNFISNNIRMIVKEQQNIEGETTIDIDISDAVNHISLNTYDESGELLVPGTVNPTTGIASKVFVNRFLYFNPSGTNLTGGLYIQDLPLSGEPYWNFYINNVSDRYSFFHTFSAAGYEQGMYSMKHQPLSGISSDVTIENNPASWVYHTEKFKPSKLSESTYAAFSNISTIDNKVVGGMTIYDTTSEVTDEQAFKGFIYNPLEEANLNLVAFPAAVDYFGIVPPGSNQEAFLIRGNGVVSTADGSVSYGSGNSSTGKYTIGNEYYFNNNAVAEVLPFHPRFSYSLGEAGDTKQGDNVPIIITSRSRFNIFNAQFKGRYGERRESDFFATDAEVKQDGNVIFSGNFMDFRRFALPASGQIEINFTNSNMQVDGIEGKNTARITYNAAQNDAPPTLQHLQFRNSENKVTSIFQSAENGVLRLAAGDFKHITIDAYDTYYDYEAGNSVEFQYSLHGQDQWSSIELTKNDDYFQMPAFGDYYEASLEGVSVPEENSWFDVKIICTDASGNKQEQIISPAFKVEQATMGVTDAKNNNFVIYPNPVKDILKFSTEVSHIQITDMSGKMIKQLTASAKSVNVSSLPKGNYIITAIGKSGEKISKKFIKE